MTPNIEPVETALGGRTIAEALQDTTQSNGAQLLAIGGLVIPASAALFLVVRRRVWYLGNCRRSHVFRFPLWGNQVRLAPACRASVRARSRRREPFGRRKAVLNSMRMAHHTRNRNGRCLVRVGLSADFSLDAAPLPARARLSNPTRGAPLIKSPVSSTVVARIWANPHVSRADRGAAIARNHGLDAPFPPAR